MGLEEVPYCSHCEKLKKDLEERTQAFTASFSTLKQKIITTDLLIKKYSLKCQEYTIQSKTLQETNDVVTQLQRDCSRYESELSRILLEVEPLRKENAALKVSNNDVCKEISVLKEKVEAAVKVEQQYFVTVKDYERKSCEHKSTIASLTEELNALKKESSSLRKLKDELSALKSTTKKYKTKAKKNYKTCAKHVIAFGSHLQSHNLLNKRAKKIFDKYVEQLSSQTSWSECDDASQSESDYEDAGLQLEKLFLENDVQDNASTGIPNSVVQKEEIEKGTQTAPTNAVETDNDLLFDLIDDFILKQPMLSPLPPSPKRFSKSEQKMLSKSIQVDNRMDCHVDEIEGFELEAISDNQFKNSLNGSETFHKPDHLSSNPARNLDETSGSGTRNALCDAYESHLEPSSSPTRSKAGTDELENDFQTETSDCLIIFNNGNSQQDEPSDDAVSNAIHCDIQTVPVLKCSNAPDGFSVASSAAMLPHCPASDYATEDISPNIQNKQTSACEIDSSNKSPSQLEVTDDYDLIPCTSMQHNSSSKFSPAKNGHDYVCIVSGLDMLSTVEISSVLDENVASLDTVKISDSDITISDLPVPENLNNVETTSALSSSSDTMVELNGVKQNSEFEKLSCNEGCERGLGVIRDCITLSCDSEKEEQELRLSSVHNNNQFLCDNEPTNCEFNECLSSKSYTKNSDARLPANCVVSESGDSEVEDLLIGGSTHHPNITKNSKSDNFLPSRQLTTADQISNPCNLPSEAASLQNEACTLAQHSPSSSFVCQSSISESNPMEKSVAFLKIGRTIHSSFKSSLCDDHVVFIRKGRLVKNLPIMGLTDDRKFLPHYVEQYDVMTSTSNLLSATAEKPVNIFNGLQRRLSTTCTAANESLSIREGRKDTSKLCLGADLNPPLNLCDALLRLQTTNFSSCSCCGTLCKSCVFPSCPASVTMWNLQDYLKPHGCCTHVSECRNPAGFSCQPHKTYENVSSSQQGIAEDDRRDKDYSCTNEPLSPNVHQCAKVPVPSNVEPAKEQVIERTPVNVNTLSSNSVKAPLQLPESVKESVVERNPQMCIMADVELSDSMDRNPTESLSPIVPQSPEIPVLINADSQNDKVTERTPGRICVDSTNFVKGTVKLPESFRNSPVVRNPGQFRMAGVELLKPAKKRSTKKSLRSKIADCLRYRKGGKSPKLLPAVGVGHQLPTKTVSQYTNADLNLMMDCFILKDNMKKPLSPIKDDVFMNDNVLSSTKSNQCTLVDEVSSIQIVPAQRKWPRKRKTCTDVASAALPDKVASQKSPDRSVPFKKPRHDEDAVPRNICDASAIMDECDMQREEPPEIIDNQGFLKSGDPKNTSCSCDSPWLRNSNSIFFKEVPNKSETTKQKIGANVINGIIQLLEPLPVEGHQHIWQSVADRLSSSLAPVHVPLLSRKLRNWIMSTSSDRLSVAIEVLQTRSHQNDGSQTELVLGVTERKCLRLFKHIRLKNNMQEFEHHLFVNAMNSILDKNTTSFGRAALCRFLVALCKLQENLEKARVVCYDILFWIIHVSGPLVIQALGIWPEIFQMSECSDNSVFRVFIHILVRKSPKIGFSIEFSVEGFLKAVFDIGNLSCNLEELVSDLLQRVKSDNQETSFEAIKAIELLSRTEGWQWTNNCLVIKKLWPIFQRWVQPNVDDADKISNTAMSNYLYLLGCVTRQCPKSNRISVVEVLKRMDALLEKSLSITVAWSVQEAALSVVIMLLPFDKDLAVTAISKWLPNNKEKLSDSLKKMLNAVLLDFNTCT